jgi:DNA-binding CsgD family transcriptional regulator
LFLQAAGVGVGGEAARSVSLYEEALSEFRDVGDEAWGAYALLNLGWAARERGEAAQAAAYAEEALATQRAIGDGWGAGLSLDELAQLAEDRGDFPRAAALQEESLRGWHALGDEARVAEGLFRAAAIAAALGQVERTVHLYQAAERLRAMTGVGVDGDVLARTQARLAGARAQLGEDAFAAAQAAGRRLPVVEALAEASAVSSEYETSRQPRATWTNGLGLDLTQRERQVLGLMAEGHSNQDIADTLFISLRTAQTHVASILRKLDVGSRTAASTYAVRHGLA